MYNLIALIMFSFSWAELDDKCANKFSKERVWMIRANHYFYIYENDTHF